MPYIIEVVQAGRTVEVDCLMILKAEMMMK